MLKNLNNTTLIATTGHKGGTGKSLYGCVLLDFLRTNGSSVAAYDGDGAIGTMSEMHGFRTDDGTLAEEQDRLSGVVSYNIRDESRATLINSLAMGDNLILHDIAGGALADLQRIFDDEGNLKNLFSVLEDVDAQIVFAHLLTPDTATIESVALHIDLTDSLGDLGKRARHLAVLNRHAGRKNSDFSMWFGREDVNGQIEGGLTRSRLLDAGGAEMDLPALAPDTLAKLVAQRIPFGRAQRHPSLTLIDQQRVRIFRTEFERQMTPHVRNLLGVE
jgi:hypothetical protein